LQRRFHHDQRDHWFAPPLRLHADPVRLARQHPPSRLHQRHILRRCPHHRLPPSTGLNFINILWAAITCADPKSAKKYCQAVNLFWIFSICTPKSCSENDDEIESWYQFHRNSMSSFCASRFTLILLALSVQWKKLVLTSSWNWV